jgi:cystathionine beta-lyase/cystathionine gamma-synthase
MDHHQLDIATRLVHAGERQPWPVGQPVSTPIYASTTFTYGSMADADAVLGGEKPGYIYTRYGNPTVTALEQAILSLEGGAAACAYASGMAALHAALLACELSPGSTILASRDLYGATLDLLVLLFGQFDVKTVTADFSDLPALEAKALEVRPHVLVAETISNPLLKICDIDACAKIAKAHHARLIVDNTFASPYLCRPLEHGADFVVHSATKYLSGHADAMGGLVIAKESPDHQALISIMTLAGGVLGPWEAHEILRGIKTLGLRIERQCTNAHRIAQQLATNPLVARVYYPALPGAESLEILQRVLRPPYAGAIISIELVDAARDAAFRFMDALRICVRATSLGDIFTGVLHPATSTHREMSPARRRQAGISDGLIRISVGIEDVNDLLEDLEQALNASSVSANSGAEE